MKRKRSVFDMDVDEIIDAMDRIAPLLRRKDYMDDDDEIILDAMDCDDDEIIDYASLDRISSLPDPIVHHIMSYLPTKDAVKTTVLSKTWQLLTATFPILDFDQTFFPNQQQRYRKYVDETLQRFRHSGLSIQKVRFRLNHTDSVLTSLVDKWIALSIENHVKELDIHIQQNSKFLTSFPSLANAGRQDVGYCLPQTVFAAKSITRINLHRCRLDPHLLSSSGTIRFNSIRELSFEKICLDDQITDKLIAACPLIEVVVIVDCSGLERLKFSRLLRLKKVEVRRSGLGRIDIEEAPSLESFVCWQLSKPCLINMVECRDLKGLMLIGTVANDEFFHDFTSKFPLLETLHLTLCSELKRLVISSSKLKKLTLQGCLKLVDTHIDTPNLISFNYYGGTIPISSSMNASCVWEVRIVPSPEVHLNTLWFLKLKEFLAKSNQVKILELTIASHENKFDLEDLIGTAIPPNCEAEHLNVEVPSSQSDPAPLVDGLLWSCRPKSLSITKNSEFKTKFMQYLGQKLMEREVYEHCCSSRDIKCWRHYIEEIKMESSNDIQKSLEGGLLHFEWSPHVVGLLIQTGTSIHGRI